MGLFKINCQEGKMLCDKSQYNEISFWEKIKLNMYLVVCSDCRSYTIKNNKLTKAMKSPKLKSITAAEKNTLKERLAQEMSQ